MNINTALILCAGFGKRLKPITLETPKPLIKIDDYELLERTLHLIKNLNIKNIKINTFYLEHKIEDFILNHSLKTNIEIIKDGKHILDTGGGILNLINSSSEDDFIVFNPDTVWNINYTKTINQMIDFYFSKKIENILMVVNKSKSFDKRFKGDFDLRKNNLFKEKNCDYIYTGCQIINKKLFNGVEKKIFSISKIWDVQIAKNKLYGFESLENFTHLTDLKIYNELIKKPINP